MFPFKTTKKGVINGYSPKEGSSLNLFDPFWNRTGGFLDDGTLLGGSMVDRRVAMFVCLLGGENVR